MPELLPFHRVRLWQKAALTASLLLYTTLIALTLPHHEPWADEAQAWQLARSNSFLHLFHTAIHYEVSPGLWHALLWLLIRLHLPYAGLPWISAALTLCAVALLLFASPFPLALRVALPFTYFFAYQYSIVARNYALFAPLLFALAALWPRRHSHPLLLATLLALLANVSAHGLIAAVGLTFILLVEILRPARAQDTPRPQPALAQRLAAAAILLLSLAFATWCMVPPHDANWAVGAAHALHRPSTAAAEHLSTLRHPLHSIPTLLLAPLQLCIWIIHVLGFGVTQPKLLAAIAWGLLIWTWARECRLRYLAPVVLLAGLCIFSRFETYHAGLIWLLLLFLWWITWPATANPRQFALLLLFSVFTLSQILWTLRAIRYDTTQPYSPDLAAVAILQRYQAAGKRIDIEIPPPPQSGHAGFYAVGLEPYFATEPFHNASARYWIWKPQPAMAAQYASDTASRSAVALLETIDGQFADPEQQQRLLSLGYRQDATTCGRVFYPLQYQPELCHVFYVPR